jgi:putative serine protease PepD
MMRVRTLAILAAALTATALAATGCGGGSKRADAPAVPAPSAGGFDHVVAQAMPSVVQIQSAKGLGSGVVFDRAGHVVTNAHVVAGSRTFQVTLADGSTHTGTLVGTFVPGDLAVVHVHGAKLRPATFADSSRVRVGQYALAIGNPLGLRSSVTQGIVSSTSRTVSEGSGVALPAVIQTSAPINPGNSGGALVDASGAVIGIPTLAATDPEFDGAAADGIGFAISSNTVKQIAGQLVAHGRVVDSGRAWLGVDLRSLPTGGVLVASVVRNGPAEAAGIRQNDVIVKLGGRLTPTADDVAVALAAQRPGAGMAVELVRGGATEHLHVTPGQTPTGS